MTPDGRIPVVLFDGDAAHLRSMHGIPVLDGTSSKILTRIHQASHFSAASGGPALRVGHYHSLELTERLAEEARIRGEAEDAYRRLKAGLPPDLAP